MLTWLVAPPRGDRGSERRCEPHQRAHPTAGQLRAHSGDTEVTGRAGRPPPTAARESVHPGRDTPQGMHPHTPPDPPGETQPPTRWRYRGHWPGRPPPAYCCPGECSSGTGHSARYAPPHAPRPPRRDPTPYTLAIQRSLAGPAAPRLLLPGRVFIRDGTLRKVRTPTRPPTPQGRPNPPHAGDTEVTGRAGCPPPTAAREGVHPGRDTPQGTHPRTRPHPKEDPPQPTVTMGVPPPTCSPARYIPTFPVFFYIIYWISNNIYRLFFPHKNAQKYLFEFCFN